MVFERHHRCDRGAAATSGVGLQLRLGLAAVGSVVRRTANAEGWEQSSQPRRGGARRSPSGPASAPCGSRRTASLEGSSHIWKATIRCQASVAPRPQVRRWAKQPWATASKSRESGHCEGQRRRGPKRCPSSGSWWLRDGSTVRRRQRIRIPVGDRHVSCVSCPPRRRY